MGNTRGDKSISLSACGLCCYCMGAHKDWSFEMRVRFSIVFDGFIETPDNWAITRTVQEITDEATHRFDDVKLKHLSIHVDEVTMQEPFKEKNDSWIRTCPCDG